MSNEVKIEKNEKRGDSPTPAVIIFGPQGCGKTTLADLLMKFFETTKLVDDFDPVRDACPFEKLEKGTLYLSQYPFNERDILHAGMAHGVVIMDFYNAMTDLGGARGRTAPVYFAEMMFGQFIADAIKLGGPKRGPGGAPRKGNLN